MSKAKGSRRAARWASAAARRMGDGARAGARGLGGARTIRLACLGVALLAPSFGCKGGDDAPFRRDGYEILDLALQPLRRDFESYYGQYRIVAVVAPTCGSCLDNCDRIFDTLRPWAEENDAEIFILWGSVMPTDAEIRVSQRVEAYASPRIHHYWDDSGRTTRAFGRMLGLPGNGDAYDVFFAYGPNATWDPGGTMDSEGEDFSVALSLWSPGRPDVAAMSGDLNKVSLPEFTAAEMIRLLDEHRAAHGGGTSGGTSRF